jgi:hypothetical protein
LPPLLEIHPHARRQVAAQLLPLAPRGRELAGERVWNARGWGGRADCRGQ